MVMKRSSRRVDSTTKSLIMQVETLGVSPDNNSDWELLLATGQRDDNESQGNVPWADRSGNGQTILEMGCGRLDKKSQGGTWDDVADMG